MFDGNGGGGGRAVNDGGVGCEGRCFIDLYGFVVFVDSLCVVVIVT